ncbi:hypothetical protein EST38_g11844 [Candolleomyces aberdarensis]|uniref:Uncharacterized protein n=1 Tax=Candolleomyces aberdarensis TaxID=2316362 RepID=A0A4Q2D3X5_9AGAR|nr:hypothetical protein EST38_g11844 [Candolleomyces aberdarensis]
MRFDCLLINSASRALINIHSAVSHLSHFCAIISRSGNADNRPIYDLNPPRFALGWHSTLFHHATQSLFPSFGFFRIHGP